MMIGERLRDARTARGLSLTDVAGKAAISAATLSRIENSKQGLDLSLFLELAKILCVLPAELLSAVQDGDGDGNPLAGRIASLACIERAKLWRDLTETRRKALRARSVRQDNLEHRLEELFAQFEFMHEELNAMRMAVRRRKADPRPVIPGE